VCRRRTRLEDGGPLAKGAIQRLHVSLGDAFEEQIGVAIGVRQIAELVDHEQRRCDVAMQTTAERGGAVLGVEVTKHRGRGGEAGREAVHDGVVGEILGEHGLTDAVGTERGVEFGGAALVRHAVARDPIYLPGHRNSRRVGSSQG